MTEKNNDNAPNTPKPQLTRIPLDQVTFTAGNEQDLPGLGAVAPSVAFGLPKVAGRQYYLGFFVPSYQVVDIEYHRPKEEPLMFMVPLTAIRAMKRNTKKP